MAGYICIAMLEDPPYNMILGATEEEPENWLEELPLPSHLLCYEAFDGFGEALAFGALVQATLESEDIKNINIDAIIRGKAFPAKAHEVILAYLYARGMHKFSLINNSDEVNDQDQGESVDYHLLAEQGDAEAQCKLGVMYSIGDDVEQDNEQAVVCYRKAAEQGHATAQYNLGVMYANGSGIEENDEQAVFWHHKAAEQGHTTAQLNLGMMYTTGSCVEQDDKQAFAWYLKAAEQDEAAAQFNVGANYYNGTGVRKNKKQAVIWLHKAANQGFVAAQEALTGLGVDWNNS
jgi:hypothetical protein